MAEYKIFGDLTEATVSDVGGTVLSFRFAGKDIIYLWRKTADGKERGGIPICAPWFGSYPKFGDRKHGYLRELEATKVRRRGNSGLEMVFEHPGNQKYPWAMKYDFSVRMQRRMLILSLKITRQDDGLFDLAPVCPGFHPYFFGDSTYTLVEISGRVHEKFSKESVSLPIQGSSLAVWNRNSGKKVATMILGDDFSSDSTIVFWSDNPKEYFCVEPILEDKVLFNTSSGRRLRIGESVEMGMILSP